MDVRALRAVLATRLGPDGGGFRLDPVAGGQSNPTFFLDHGGRRLVLRKQPPGPLLKGAHAIDREWRVLRALSGTALPVPRPVLYHDDPAPLGTPFYLMERVDGRVLTDTSLAALPPEDRRPIWMAVADTLATLHGIDPEAVGLGDFGRPGGYFARQLAGWGRRHRESPSGPVREIARLEGWLEANLPGDDGATAICHGDFRLGNLLFHPTEPRVLAVLDWELSTLGHPLADLGFCLMPWHTAPEEYGGLLGLDLAALRLPAEREVAARYDMARPGSPPLTEFHRAFALYRFSVIFLGIADRAAQGSAADPDAARLGPLARRFASRALDLVGR
jgi:aminoglycoside phosphotransferase (APT) family kinase protein